MAAGMMLVLEGLGPFAFPAKWAQTMRQLSELPPGALRLAGLLSMLLGFVLLTIFGP